MNDSWTVQGELRYSYLDDAGLTEESGLGKIKGLDYDPVIMQLGVIYRF